MHSGTRFYYLLKHYIVECLIRDYHLKHSHAGVPALTVIIREEFWIIGARRRIRSVVKQFVRCKRFSAKPPAAAPIQLQLDRVRDAFAFEVTGIDLCGPLILKNKNKAWVVLFTFAVYRCVHLELVTSVSTECFIQAFRRFIARRGRPSIVYSDNGTNFVGTSALLKKVDWVKVISFCIAEKGRLGKGNCSGNFAAHHLEVHSAHCCLVGRMVGASNSHNQEFDCESLRTSCSQLRRVTHHHL
ncbi:hypothetical protein X975_05448, partial [Stegodyphus mimosarum]